MKLYTLYTESHKVLYDNYFLPTLPEEFQLVNHEEKQLCESGAFMASGWSDICYKKVLLFRQACEENLGGHFAWADVDIQFFGNCKDIMLQELGEYDIACQNDFGTSHCSGLFICNANSRTLNMFTSMVNDYHREDQTTLNLHIGKVKNKFLSSIFYNYGQSRGVVWKGDDFEFDRNIIVHHANWTVGIDNKIKMLDYVKSKINGV